MWSFKGTGTHTCNLVNEDRNQMIKPSPFTITIPQRKFTITIFQRIFTINFPPRKFTITVPQRKFTTVYRLPSQEEIHPSLIIHQPKWNSQLLAVIIWPPRENSSTMLKPCKENSPFFLAVLKHPAWKSATFYQSSTVLHKKLTVFDETINKFVIKIHCFISNLHQS